jgi:acetyltransferase-like isoleucine patch superfamily enzyme
VSPVDHERRAFEDLVDGKPIPLASLARMAGTALLDPLRMVTTHMPGPFGYGLRRLLFRRVFNSIGKNCILDVGLRIVGGHNISVGEYTWIDAYVSVGALFGPVSIGKRIHVAPFTMILAGAEGIEIEDYVAIGAGTQIYGHSETARGGKRMSGPMIPWRFKSHQSGKVVISKDCFVGAGSIILPGTTIGEGAVVGAGSVITRDVAPWSIVFGSPARVVGRRDPVTQPDI